MSKRIVIPADTWFKGGPTRQMEVASIFGEAKTMARPSFLSRTFGFTRDPLVMVVEAATSDNSISAALEGEKFRIARAHSVSEAIMMIDDLHFVRVKLDGILADFRLKDGLAYRVIEHFLETNPDIPAAVMLDEHDVTVSLWARNKGVLLLNSSPALGELNPWLERLKVPA
jgi:hypothetical protein